MQSRVSHTREAEENVVQTEEKYTQRRRPCEDGARDGSDTATRQGILAATRSWKGQGTDSPTEPSEVHFRQVNMWTLGRKLERISCWEGQ